MKNVSILLAFLLLGFKNSNAQTCTISYSVAFSDGKTVQVGLTAEQKKFLEGDGTKRYKGICLNPANPDYLILWTEGLSGSELAKVTADAATRGRATGETTSTPSGSARLNAPGNSSGWLESGMTIKRSSVVRGQAYYWILDNSKNPPQIVHNGEGHQDVPQNSRNDPGHAVNTSDFASTISDPTEALNSALKWIKKERKP